MHPPPPGRPRRMAARASSHRRGSSASRRPPSAAPAAWKCMASPAGSRHPSHLVSCHGLARTRTLHRARAGVPAARAPPPQTPGPLLLFAGHAQPAAAPSPPPPQPPQTPTPLPNSPPTQAPMCCGHSCQKSSCAGWASLTTPQSEQHCSRGSDRQFQQPASPYRARLQHAAPASAAPARCAAARPIPAHTPPSPLGSGPRQPDPRPHARPPRGQRPQVCAPTRATRAPLAPAQALGARAAPVAGAGCHLHLLGLRGVRRRGPRGPGTAAPEARAAAPRPHWRLVHRRRAAAAVRRAATAVPKAG